MAPFDSHNTTFWLVCNCKYISILYRCGVIWRWKYRDLKIWVRGHSRSLKMVPFKSKDTVSYSHSIATMAVSSAVSTQYTNMTQPARHRTIATVALRSLARLRSAAKITIESWRVKSRYPSPVYEWFAFTARQHSNVEARYWHKQGFFNVQFYTKTAVLNGFVQF